MRNTYITEVIMEILDDDYLVGEEVEYTQEPYIKTQFPFPAGKICPKCGGNDTYKNSDYFECPCGIELWREPPMPYSDKDGDIRTCVDCGKPTTSKAVHGPYYCDACRRNRRRESWRRCRRNKQREVVNANP